MNDKNKALIFDESNDVIITITDEDGNEADVYIIAAMEIEELGKEFVAALPVKGTKDFPEDEALILEYSHMFFCSSRAGVRRFSFRVFFCILKASYYNTVFAPALPKLLI